MSVDQALCCKYIGRDTAFWQEAEAALELARTVAGAQELLTDAEAALLDRKDSAKGGRLMNQFAKLVTPAAGPMATVGALGSMLPRAILPYQEQGADDEMIRETFGDMLRWVTWYKRHNGRDGLAELGWVVIPYANHIYKIGSLQYERIKSNLPVQVFRAPGGSILLFSSGGVYMDQNGEACSAESAETITIFKQQNGELHGHLIDPVTGRIDPKETIIPADGLTPVLKPGDDVLTMHIPAGTSLRPSDVDDSLRRAHRFFGDLGLRYPIAICHSWLLDPQLEEMLPKNSNILNLAHRFARVSMAGPGSAPRYIFMTDVAPEKLPPEAVKTHLQQAAMAHLNAGGRFYDFGGAMLLN